MLGLLQKQIKDFQYFYILTLLCALELLLFKFSALLKPNVVVYSTRG